MYGCRNVAHSRENAGVVTLYVVNTSKTELRGYVVNVCINGFFKELKPKFHH